MDEPKWIQLGQLVQNLTLPTLQLHWKYCAAVAQGVTLPRTEMGVMLPCPMTLPTLAVTTIYAVVFEGTLLISIVHQRET